MNSIPYMAMFPPPLKNGPKKVPLFDDKVIEELNTKKGIQTE